MSGYLFVLWEKRERAGLDVEESFACKCGISGWVFVWGSDRGRGREEELSVSGYVAFV